MGITTAVWGSRNSGKTTFSTLLADELSNIGSVALLFADTDAPPIPFVFPSLRDSEIRSAGTALTAVELSEEKILESATVSHNSGILYLGYGPGENRFSYPSYGEGRAELFIMLLSRIADYVVIDCPSHITGNPLAEAALKTSKQCFRLYTPENSSFSFFASEIPLLKRDSFHTESHYRILNMINKEICYPEAEAKAFMNRCDAVLPYSPRIRQLLAEGRLAGGNPGKAYTNALLNIVKKTGKKT